MSGIGNGSDLPEESVRYRNDYRKLEAVVSLFNEKVGDIVDAQTKEYLQAFEQHMLVVQQELQALRLKTTAIANDKTKDEKLRQLDADRQRYRQEAMRLDTLASELQDKLTNCRNKVLEAESERDWHVQQLKIAQAKHSKMVALMNKQQEQGEAHFDGLQQQQHQKSLYQSSDVNMSTRRSQSRVQHKMNTNATHKTDQDLLPRLWDSTDMSQHSELMPSNRLDSKYEDDDWARQELLARLLQLRSCKMELQSMLQRCQEDVGHERWRKHGIVMRQSLEDILSQYNNDKAVDKDMIDELLAHAETHEAICSIVFDSSTLPKSCSVDDEHEEEDEYKIDDKYEKEDGTVRYVIPQSPPDNNGSISRTMKLSAQTRRYLGLA